MRQEIKVKNDLGDEIIFVPGKFLTPEEKNNLKISLDKLLDDPSAYLALNYDIEIIT